MASMIGTAGTLATVTAMGSSGISVAYQLTSLLMYKVAEGAVNTAIKLMASGGDGDTPGKVQFTLMELDVEAKFKAVRSLMYAIRSDEVNLRSNSKTFINVCINNVEQVMQDVVVTLTRIQNEMDDHAQMWFNNWRRLNVIDDLESLKALCRVFDKRLDTLIQCLSVPFMDEHSNTLLLPEKHSAENLKVYPERVGDAVAIHRSRQKSDALASRAVFDAEAISGLKTPTTHILSSSPSTTVIFEDPVFL